MAPFVEHNPIPSLFPDTLQDICGGYILRWIVSIGRQVEELAIKDENVEEMDADQRRLFLAQSKEFDVGVANCRDFLVNFVASHLVDKLVESARREDDLGRPGYVFAFSVLLNERLGRLVACHRDEESKRRKRTDSFSSDDEEEEDVAASQNNQLPWEYEYEDAESLKTKSITTALGADLFRASLTQLGGLACLTLHKVCSNEMLYTIANTCGHLQVLDVSYSHRVTDLGLIYLCGVKAQNYLPIKRRPAIGCRYLRELYANPDPGDCKPFLPSVIACLLRHLNLLEVLDMELLHDGIEHYYHHTATASAYSRVPLRAPTPLKLVHYTGSDKLAEVMAVCPKIRTFKLFVTDSLPRMGATLKTCNNSLEHVTLVYSPRRHQTLVGLKEFLAACGERISSLEIDCPSDISVQISDLADIADHCKFLDSLCFTSFKIAPNSISDFPIPFAPLRFPFLTELRLSQISAGAFGKEVFRYLLGGCDDIEKIYLSFGDTAYFFSDFLLDDILQTNPLGRLEQFILKDVSLTLISALRLISSRPKLRSVGRLMKWDVEPSELVTFAQILRKANSMKLLQEINIV